MGFIDIDFGRSDTARVSCFFFLGVYAHLELHARVKQLLCVCVWLGNV